MNWLKARDSFCTAARTYFFIFTAFTGIRTAAVTRIADKRRPVFTAPAAFSYLTRFRPSWPVV
ncbi:hypothetical protein [Methanosarcina siciliae]|uniref:hypothetical protein n=1 Tax=Methanosarcina siciliae TaxID=38027 RepID=UPI0012DFF457|nr:hypothetical protein [Methanosarcina siciliae]